MTRYKQDDITLLLPSMHIMTQVVLDAMVELKFKPVLFDGMRTAAESARNAAKGTGIKQSIHEYGAACDIICDDHGWQCRAKRCKFYTALPRLYRAHGFVAGADFPMVDEPHGQGVTVAKQNAMRALGTASSSVAARDKMVRDHFGDRYVEAVKAFQLANGLVADGVLGPKTLAVLQPAK